MIEDLNDLDNGTHLRADVCIIGSGAAGITLARKFLDTTYRVLLVESGSMADEPATQELYRAAEAGMPFPGAMEGRFRTYGGTTTRWGGGAVPLGPMDFEKREWVPHSGWPLSYASMQAYYMRAADYLGIGRANFDTDVCGMLNLLPPEFDEEVCRYQYCKCAPQPNFRETQGPALRASRHVKVLFHANLVDMRLDERRQSVVRVQLKSLAGKAVTASARFVVLAMGGIETARILLACNRQAQEGIGNTTGLVGKCFQEHPSAMVGRLHPCRGGGGRRFFELFSASHLHKIKYGVRVSASEDFQRQHEILNATAMVNFDASPCVPLNVAKKAFHLMQAREFGAPFFSSMAQAAVHVPSLLKASWHLMAHHRVYNPGPDLQLEIMSEQEPSLESYVGLTDARDSLGVPQARIHWEVSPLVRRTMSVYARALKAEFERLKLAHLELHPWVEDDTQPWKEQIHDHFHHMGTTRMDASAERGVVDTDCFVHGMENLAIASTAVFPTSGFANPTFTQLALTMRLADTLKRRLDAPVAVHAVAARVAGGVKRLREAVGMG